MSVAEAEQLTGEIKIKLDDLADIHDAVMPLIREAIEREAYRSLGYKSHADYVTERFSGSLARLGLEPRRGFELEMAKAGMSAPAIAKVVGVSKDTVLKDLKSIGDHSPIELPDKIVGTDGKVRSRKSNQPDPVLVAKRTAERAELVAKRQTELEAQRAKEAERAAAKRAEEEADLEVMRERVEARGGVVKKKAAPRVVSTQDRVRAALNDSIIALTRVLNDPGLDAEFVKAEAELPERLQLETQRLKLYRLVASLKKKVSP